MREKERERERESEREKQSSSWQGDLWLSVIHVYDNNNLVVNHVSMIKT